MVGRWDHNLKGFSVMGASRILVGHEFIHRTFDHSNNWSSAYLLRSSDKVVYSAIELGGYCDDSDIDHYHGCDQLVWSI